MQLPHETYQGINVRLRYAVVTMQRSYGNTVAQGFVPRRKREYLRSRPRIKMELASRTACIEFEYAKASTTKTSSWVNIFLLVRIKIKHMS